MYAGVFVCIMYVCMTLTISWIRIIMPRCTKVLYVCMCVYVCMYVVCMYVCMYDFDHLVDGHHYAKMHKGPVCMYVCMYARMYVFFIMSRCTTQGPKY